MEFLGIGTQEVIIILLVFVIFVGPARLPEVARQLGKAYRKMKEATGELTQEFQQMGEEVKSSAKEVEATVNPAVGIKDGIKGVYDEFNSVKKDLLNISNPTIEKISHETTGNRKVADQGIGTNDNVPEVQKTEE